MQCVPEHFLTMILKSRQPCVYCQQPFQDECVCLCSPRNSSIFEKKRADSDPTQLIWTFEVTDLVGIVSPLVIIVGMSISQNVP